MPRLALGLAGSGLLLNLGLVLLVLGEGVALGRPSNGFAAILAAAGGLLLVLGLFLLEPRREAHLASG